MPDSSFWNQDTSKFQSKALALRKAGDLAGAEAIYLEGFEDARLHGDLLAEVRYLMSAAGCQLLASRYRAALATFLGSREIANESGDTLDAGAIEVNLSSLYLQMWDVPAATLAAENALQFAQSLKKAYWQAPLYLQLGRLQSLQHPEKAGEFLIHGINAAREQDQLGYESIGWDLLGQHQLAAGDLRSAEFSLGEALRIRRYWYRNELGLSWSQLGALKLAQGDLETAYRLTELALEALTHGQPAWPEHLLLTQRARIRFQLKTIPSALQDFSLAVEATARWRLEALPSRSVLVNIDDGLEKSVFDAFATLAAGYALHSNHQDWREQSFVAVEMNRAANLRASVDLSEAWRSKLPPEYWVLSSRLHALESQRAVSLKRNSREMERLRLKLTELESQVNAGVSANKSEIFGKPGSLILFQQRLRGSELFLSFKLGKTESFLWAVTRDSLSLYRLAAEQDIRNAVGAFREALLAGGAEAIQQEQIERQQIQRGQKLYQTLFGQIGFGQFGHKERRKTAWLLSLEGPLFGVPFAALVAEHKGGKTVYLADNNSVQIVPGAFLLRMPGEQAGIASGGRFLGVGDPIYNQADPRWQNPGWQALGWQKPDGQSPVSTGQLRAEPLVQAAGQLQRLTGSAREVAASAEVWRTVGDTEVEELTGAAANLASFRHALEKQPAVIHLATHVVAAAEERDRSLIALSLMSEDQRQPVSRFGAKAKSQTSPSTSAATLRPEYLTAAEIANLDARQALVVLTGCASGEGEAHRGAGLLGLTHAWLAAGAHTVLATAWPVEDDTGVMFASFYQHLKSAPAAEALRRTQAEQAHAEMRHRRDPRRWASFQVTGVAH